MACCAAIALVFGLVRWGWRSLTLRGTTESALPLPPQAHRPAPGAGPADATPSPRPVALEARPRRRERAVCVLRAAAAGAGGYAAAVAVLLSAGAAERLGSPAVGWLVRDVAFVALAAAALIVAVAIERPGDQLAVRERLACVLVGAGAAWLGLGIVDQHLFELFEVGGGGLGWDLVFHGAGEVALVGGMVGLRSRRPSAAWRPAETALTAR